MAATPNLQKAAGNKFATTLSGSLTAGGLSMSLSSTTGLNTAGGYLIIDEANTSKREIVYYESYTGSTLTIASDGRGREGTTGVSHDSGATVTDVITAGMFNGTQDAFATEHNDNGTHKATNLINLLYPVGTIYTSVVATNPGTLFGVGTWVAFGAGKTLVGLDAGQTEFDTVEETGGAKTHTLVAGEMPVHTHSVTDPGHSHNITKMNNGIGAPFNGVQGSNLSDTNSGSFISSSTTGITLANAGSGDAHNNLQPYIVVYFFKRTA